MCLQLINPPIKHIADEDVICYKYILSSVSFHGDRKSLDGKEFNGVINGIRCNGVISIDFKETGDDIYFCTNNAKLCGTYTYKKFGYRYSYILDTAVEEISVVGAVNGKFVKQIITPFQGAIVEVGNTYESELRVDVYYDNYEINKGLHSFEFLNDCQFYSKDACNKHVVKCVIPKGSEFYKGSFSGYSGYASNKITYVEIVK